MRMVNRIIEVAYHRNGVSGRGFNVVTFYGSAATGMAGKRFLATLTDTPGECYVVCTDLLPTCGVAFGEGNSWRGDEFEPELRRAVEEWDEKRFSACADEISQ